MIGEVPDQPAGWIPARLVPKLFDLRKHYSRTDLFGDLVAGLTVGLVALPLALAFAISSGVKPEAGIYTAIIGGLVVSALGGSRCQISGPTGAFVVIVAGIVAKFGVGGLLICTLMAGGMLLILGLTGLGAAVRYIPRPVTIGFTNGIAVLIASTQLKDFFGLTIDSMPSDFLGRMRSLFEHAGTIQWLPTGLAAGTVCLIAFWPRVTKRVPGSLVALILGTVLCVTLGYPGETIGSRFGGIPTGLPALAIPEFHREMIPELLPSAVTVALLAAIESLLSAVVADTMSGDRHRPDAEVVAQGAANLIVPFVGGIPITGAIARTATNIRCGAKSPVAGIIHGLVLVAVILVAAPLARHIPLAVLAGILMMVAYAMGEWREIPAILRLSWADRVVWGATFALTVLADLTVAVEIGMLLAALLFIRQVASSTSVATVSDHEIQDGQRHVLHGKNVPDDVTVIRIRGPFLFGATGKLEDAARQLPRSGRVLILKLNHMTAIDGTGIHALESFAEQVHRSGKTLLLCGHPSQPEALIRRSRLPQLLGEGNLLPDIESALARVAEMNREFGGVGPSIANAMSQMPN